MAGEAETLLTTEHNLPEPHYCHCRPTIIQMVTPDKVLLEVIDRVLIPRNISWEIYQGGIQLHYNLCLIDYYNK